MFLKRFIPLIIVLLLAAYLLTPMALALPESESRLVRVGYVPNYSTIIEPVKSGHEGYGYEYLMEVAKHNNWTLEFVSCATWDIGLTKLNNGEIDLFGPDGKTEERLAEYEFPEQSIGMANAVLLARMDDPIGFNDFAAFDGKSVGVTSGSIFYGY